VDPNRHMKLVTPRHIDQSAPGTACRLSPLGRHTFDVAQRIRHEFGRMVALGVLKSPVPTVTRRAGESLEHVSSR
jgi:hypothetical protein